MYIYRLSVFACSLVLFTFAYQANAGSPEDASFLSGISGVELPETPSPSSAPTQDTPSAAVVTKRSEHSTRRTKNVRPGVEAMLRKENLLLKKEIAKLNRKGGTPSKETSDGMSRKTTAQEKKIQRLSVENAHLQEANSMMKQQFMEQQKKLNDQKNTANSELLQLKKRLLTLTEQNAQISAGNNKLKENDVSLKAQLLNMQTKLNDKQKCDVNEYNVISHENKMLKAQQAQFTTANAELKMKEEKQLQQISDLQSTMANEKKILLEKNSKLTTDSSVLKQSNDALQQKNAELQTKIASLIQDQKKHLKNESSGKTLIAKPLNPENQEQKRSYTAGAILAKDIQDKIKHNQKLGLKIDGDMMLAGLLDGYHGHLRLDTKELSKISNEMNQTLSELVTAQMKKTNQILEKATAGKKIIDRENGIVVVLEKRGSTAYKKNSTVTFDSREVELNGKPIVNSFNNKITYTDKIPPLLHKIIEKGRDGGHVVLYGLAGNIYTSAHLPEGIQPGVPVKIEFTLH